MVFYFPGTGITNYFKLGLKKKKKQKQLSYGQSDHRAMFLLQLSMKYFFASFSLLAGPSIHDWQSTVSFQHSPLSSASVLPVCLQIHMTSSVVKMKSHSIQVHLTDLTQTSPYGTYFQVGVHEQSSGFRISTYIFGRPKFNSKHSLIDYF